MTWAWRTKSSRRLADCAKFGDAAHTRCSANCCTRGEIRTTLRRLRTKSSGFSVATRSTATRWRRWRRHTTPRTTRPTTTASTCGRFCTTSSGRGSSARSIATCSVFKRRSRRRRTLRRPSVLRTPTTEGVAGSPLRVARTSRWPVARRWRARDRRFPKMTAGRRWQASEEIRVSGRRCRCTMDSLRRAGVSRPAPRSYQSKPSRPTPRAVKGVRAISWSEDTLTRDSSEARLLNTPWRDPPPAIPSTVGSKLPETLLSSKGPFTHAIFDFAISRTKRALPCPARMLFRVDWRESERKLSHISWRHGFFIPISANLGVFVAA